MLTPVGIVGLGNAGSALATALSRETPLLGFDLDPEKRAAAAGPNIECVDQLSDVAARARAVVLSLPKPNISQAVTDELVGGPQKPDLIIETSTITPGVARELAQTCEAHGVSFVDAAIAGGVAGMAAGNSKFLVGGSDEDVAKARPILEAMGRTILHLGPAGAGEATKVVNNAVMHAVMVVLIEAATMASRSGIEMQTFVDLMKDEEGLLRPLTHRVQERIMNGNYDGGMSVSNARKDSVLALAMAQELGVPLYAIQASHTPYEIAQASGLGEQDYASLATLWEQWTGASFPEG